MSRTTATCLIDTPVGPILISGDDTQLTRIKLLGSRLPPVPEETTSPLLDEAANQINNWFAGKRQDFNLPLAAAKNGADVRMRDAIAAIPYGQTLTYGAVGAHCDAIARGVGQACKTNPFPLIVPCHRVVSAQGPEFYSAGDGPRTKSWLLDFEYDHLPEERRTRLI